MQGFIKSRGLVRDEPLSISKVLPLRDEPLDISKVQGPVRTSPWTSRGAGAWEGRAVGHLAGTWFLQGAGAFEGRAIGHLEGTGFHEITVVAQEAGIRQLSQEMPTLAALAVLGAAKVDA